MSYKIPQQCEFLEDRHYFTSSWALSLVQCPVYAVSRFESGTVKATVFLWTHIEGRLVGERLAIGRHLGGYCNRLGEKNKNGADSGKNGRNVEYTKDTEITEKQWCYIMSI